MSSSPSQYDRFPTLSELISGTKVFIVNLQARPDLNGKVATVQNVLDNGRVQVSVPNPLGGKTQTLSIKPENLRIYKTVQVMEEEQAEAAAGTNNRFSDLAFCLIEFATNTLAGLESALYKTLKDGLVNVHNRMAPSLLANYLNETYKSLILQSNEYVLESFQKMKSFHKHSEICLLHMIMNICMGILQQMDCSRADFSTYDNYMYSITEQMKALGVLMLPILRDTVNHVCHGEGLEGCDPNDPLFVVSSDRKTPDNCVKTYSYELPSPAHK